MQTTAKMKKLTSGFLLISSLLVIMGSCKKDKKETPAPAPVTAKIQEYRDGDEFIRFNYNTDGTLSKATIKS
jgi:hypothetical protein